MKRDRVVPLNFAQPGKLPYRCKVLRSKRKTLAIHVHPGVVEVRCPLLAGATDIRQFIDANQDWIQSKLEEEARREQESLKIEQGRTIFYRARELEIVFREHRNKRVLVQGNQFVIQGHRLTAARASEQLEEFLIDKAADYLIPRARGLARHLGVDQKLSEIKLRKTKSKWGHCTSRGVIQYNWLIMLAPYSIIDYMITHEVCHLVHMNHSRQFWNLVDSICPGHDRYVDWLYSNEHRLWFD